MRPSNAGQRDPPRETLPTELRLTIASWCRWESVEDMPRRLRNNTNADKLNRQQVLLIAQKSGKPEHKALAEQGSAKAIEGFLIAWLSKRCAHHAIACALCKVLPSTNGQHTPHGCCCCCAAAVPASSAGQSAVSRCGKRSVCCLTGKCLWSLCDCMAAPAACKEAMQN